MTRIAKHAVEVDLDSPEVYLQCFQTRRAALDDLLDKFHIWVHHDWTANGETGWQYLTIWAQYPTGFEFSLVLARVKKLANSVDRRYCQVYECETSAAFNFTDGALSQLLPVPLHAH